MIANALASNGAAKVYIIGRREDNLKKAALSHPKYVKIYSQSIENIFSCRLICLTYKQYHNTCKG